MNMCGYTGGMSSVRVLWYPAIVIPDVAAEREDIVNRMKMIEILHKIVFGGFSFSIKLEENSNKTSISLSLFKEKHNKDQLMFVLL